MLPLKNDCFACAACLEKIVGLSATCG